MVGQRSRGCRRVPVTTRKGVEVMTSAESEGGSYASEPACYVTYAQIERLYGLSRTTAWRAIRDGHLEAARVGRSVRINRESLDRFMKERTTVIRRRSRRSSGRPERRSADTPMEM